MDIIIPVRNGLELRLRKESDAEAVFQAIDKNRTYLKQWLPWLDESTTTEDTRKFIRSDIDDFEKKNGLDLGIWYEKQWVGGIGYHGWGGKKRKSSIGYWLSEDCQGKGIMTASVQALVNHGFNEMNLNRIEIRCATENVKSRSIPQRLGFVMEGTLRQAEWLYDHFVDIVVYSTIKDEWNSCK